jgi:hypothetical protein
MVAGSMLAAAAEGDSYKKCLANVSGLDASDSTSTDKVAAIVQKEEGRSKMAGYSLEAFLAAPFGDYGMSRCQQSLLLVA